MMQARVKHTEGHYDAQEVPFGMVYKWRPEHLVEGGREADHAAYSPEELADGRLVDEVLHPWRYVKDREDAGLPF